MHLAKDREAHLGTKLVRDSFQTRERFTAESIAVTFAPGVSTTSMTSLESAAAKFRQTAFERTFIRCELVGRATDFEVCPDEYKRILNVILGRLQWL
mmetsp:Transcript_18469/g.63570  ORF Transcript_18469/g.63570 Transcript_18469/m.63570 type:complete len:97 (+) Transcript_18469:576-866(+)